MIEIDKEAVGEMSWRKIEDEIVEIGIKICNPDFQNRGYGKVILSMLIEIQDFVDFRKNDGNIIQGKK